jgi:hypothetical protein
MVSDDSKIARGMMERTACEILLRVAPNAFPFALSQTACSSLASRPKEMRVETGTLTAGLSDVDGRAEAKSYSPVSSFLTKAREDASGEACRSRRAACRNRGVWVSDQRRWS